MIFKTLKTVKTLIQCNFYILFYGNFGNQIKLTKMKAKFIFPILCASLIFVSCTEEKKQNSINVKYPETSKKPVVDSIFGTAVVDNYRWLEDDRSKETEAWVKAENEVTVRLLK